MRQLTCNLPNLLLLLLGIIGLPWQLQCMLQQLLLVVVVERQAMMML
jgi:hypothetical protein